MESTAPWPAQASNKNSATIRVTLSLCSEVTVRLLEASDNRAAARRRQTRPKYADLLPLVRELGIGFVPYSKGQHARLGLIAAEAHRPDLLILDEPSSGLDPIVRRDILEAIIRTVTDEGRTVIFSSHLLDEVERVSDHLAMLHRGTLRFCAPLSEIQARHRRISLHFERPQAEAASLPGAIRVDGAGREWTVICDAGRIHAAAMAQYLGATVVDDTVASLDEIFVAHAAN
jgi:ABC-2 type transport system ATP-binding protein